MLISILGPTACGKTGFAVALAQRLGAEIISADSRQVYRRMDLGTGKDLADYVLPDGTQVPFHLIDIAEPGTKYNLYRYQQDFLAAYDDIRSRGKQVVVCGGTGLYLESIVRSYNISHVPQNPALRERLEGKTLPELTAMLADLKALAGTALHNHTDVDSCKRAIRAIEIEEYNLQQPVGERSFPTLHSLNIGLTLPREERRARISARLHSRMEAGMLDEVRALLAEGIAPDDLIYYGLEYKYLTLHLIGSLTYEEMVAQLEIAIHQFAKRQMTWFRGMERRGSTIHWLDALSPMEEKVEAALRLIRQEQSSCNEQPSVQQQ